MEKTFIRELQAGDIVAEHIFLPNTGLPLIKAGTVISHIHLKYLEKYGLRETECFIMDGSARMNVLLPREESVLANKFHKNIH